ncbi:MAG: hypothetical protein K6B46_06570 [Opitutales bacterium]|nr:hypothetical protein [Opitutales bacterium]
MFGFDIGKQLMPAINNMIGDKVGNVTRFDFSGGNLALTIELKGEEKLPLELTISNIAYRVEDGKMNIYFETVTASRPWLSGIFEMVAEKTGKKFSIPDSMRLMPLKMLLPKKK